MELLWIRVHLESLRVYFSSGKMEVGKLRGRNFHLEERGKRADISREKEELKKRMQLVMAW